MKRKTRSNLVAYAFILPCVLILLAMMLSPTLQTLRFSFSRIKLPQFRTEFGGLSNYSAFLSRPELGRVVLNTLVWTAGAVVLRFGLGMWGALVVNRPFRGSKIWQSLILLPWTVPSIVAANIWRWMLQGDFGLVSSSLQNLGLGALSRPWLSDPSTAMPSVMVAYAWAGFPFVMLMLLAGMQGISEELYDAGKIDGANGYQLFRHITLPSLRPIIIVVVLLEIINGLNSFDFLFVMTGGGPGGVSEILGLMIYRLGFSNFDFGSASAAAVVLIGVVMGGFLLYVPASARHRGGI
jgi:multiple sugar transport system permease protein